MDGIRYFMYALWTFGESMAALVVYIISIMAAAIISIFYSYLFYKKKLATGEGLKIEYNTKKV